MLSASLSTFDFSQIRINSEDGIIAFYSEIVFKERKYTTQPCPFLKKFPAKVNQKLFLTLCEQLNTRQNKSPNFMLEMANHFLIDFIKS